MGTYEENICERKYAGMKRDSWFDNNSPSPKPNNDVFERY